MPPQVNLELAIVKLAIAMKDLCTVMGELIPVRQEHAAAQLSLVMQKVDDALHELASPRPEREGD